MGCTLLDFFPSNRPAPVVIIEEDSPIEIALHLLTDIITASQNKKTQRHELKKGMTQYDFVRHQAVHSYLSLGERGEEKMASSQLCAEFYFKQKRRSRSYVSRCIRGGLTISLSVAS
jgi:hypothetical protein